MIRRQSVVAAVSVATVLAAQAVPSFAEEAPKPSSPASAAETAKPTLVSVSCKNLEVAASWKGSGVSIVDVFGKGEPVLQVRKDPTADQASIQIPLAKEWQGRSIDVRIWDKDVKLLDMKSTDCPAKP